MKPVEFKEGCLVLNRYENNGGANITIELKKRYLEGATWKTTKNFQIWDVPKLIKLLQDYQIAYPDSK